MSEQIRGFVRLAPLLYKLDETIAGEDARRFLSAMQRFFHAWNLLTQDIDQDLLSATDNLLRVLPSSGDLPYQFGKLATSAHHLELYRKRAHFGFELAPLVGGRELRQEMGSLYGAMSSLVDDTPDIPEVDLLVLRLNIALLEYGSSQYAPKNPYPTIGRAVHDSLRHYLDYALAKHLGARLPDPLDSCTLGDIREYCRALWEDETAEHTLPVREFVSLWWQELVFRVRAWTRRR